MRIFSNSFILVVILALLWGCEKATEVESIETSAEPKDTISVTIKNTNEYIHNFQICGDEEGGTIIRQPQHAAVSEFVRNKYWDWCLVYKYIPEEGFVGKDYVEIETCTGGVGVSCNEKEIIRIEFTVVEGGEERLESFVADEYFEDAKQIYFREVINDSNHPNYDDPILNVTEINEILDIIQAVYNSNSPERDTVFEVYEIHTQYCFNLNSITIEGKTYLPEIQNLAKGIIPTGNAELDAILTTYHFDSVEKLHKDYPKYPWLILYSSQDYNLIPIEKALRSLPSIVTADFEKNCNGGGEYIRLDRNSDFTTITFSIGRGDCPSGCTYRKFWEFKVVGDTAYFIKSYERGIPEYEG